jgi:hypothetical protein
MNLHHITRIDHIAPLTLRFEFDDGMTTEHNFREEIEQFPDSPIIAGLADKAIFASAEIVRSGRAVEWANGYDLCADQWRLWTGDTASSSIQSSKTLVTA